MVASMLRRYVREDLVLNDAVPRTDSMGRFAGTVLAI